jgi:DmsE family decaheme c-type cytochrome
MASANSCLINRTPGPRLWAGGEHGARARWPRCVRAALAMLLIASGVSLVSPRFAMAQEADEGSLLDAPYSRKGADSCLACHEGLVTLAVFQGPHGVPQDARSPFGMGQLQCEACHGPGGTHAGRVRRGQQRAALIEFGSDRSTPVELQNDMCLSCHEGDLGTSWHTGVHAGGDIACADCHTSHAATDGVLNTASQAQVCHDCHSEQRVAGLKAFAHPLDEGKMSCGGCHSVHDAAGEQQLVRATLNQTCYQCHADKRGPFLWEHAPVAEDCSVCHTPHGSNHPGMLTQRGPYLCQGCHSEPGHPSLVNDAGGLAAALPSQYLLGRNCMNCHAQVHGSNHPSGSRLMR